MNDQEQIITWRGMLEGARWYRMDVWIEDECFLRNLDCTVERKTTLLTEHVRFAITGKQHKVENMIEYINRVVKERNRMT